MAVDYLGYERNLFKNLLKKLPKKEEIRLDDSFFPKEIKINRFNMYYGIRNSLWLIRIPLDNEVHYYFGLKQPNSSNEDIHLRLFLKVNENSMIKFYKSGEISIEFKIKKDNFDETFSFLKNHFQVMQDKRTKKRLFIMLHDTKNGLNFISTVSKLIKFVDFDLNLDNDYLLINGPLGNKKFPKINSQKINSNEFNPTTPYTQNISKQKSHINYDSRSSDEVKINASESSLNKIKDNFPFSTPLKNQLELISNIVNAIEEGNKFIILESGPGKSAIALTLVNIYGNSNILTSNDFNLKRYNKDFRFDSQVNVITQNDFLNGLKSGLDSPNKKLLIIDDAHRLEENIANYLSYKIELTKYDTELLNNFDCNIHQLPNKSHEIWLRFFKHLSINDDESKRLVENIKENPNNWVCSYDGYYGELLFQPLYIRKFSKKFLLDKADNYIFMSSSILDYKQFAKELGIDLSKTKFIHINLPYDSPFNQIYLRNSFDMRDVSSKENRTNLVQSIKYILKQHVNQKGIIYVYNKSLKFFIKKNIKDNRLIFHENDFNLNRFINSRSGVLVTDTIDELVELPSTQSRFQIILKQPVNIWDKRAQKKDKLESSWYDYNTAINVVQLLQKVVRSRNDHCITYIMDEKFSRFIKRDIVKNKFLPEYIINSIIDMDVNPYERISTYIRKKFGVYYLFDYVPDTRFEIRKNYDENTKRLSKEIQKYKDYDRNVPSNNLNEFEFFTEKLMNAIVELSNSVIYNEIDKIALIAVPSSTLDRDKKATMRESIKIIEKKYLEGKLNCNKEIIDCSDMLTRKYDVKISHSNIFDGRPSYLEHKKSIEFKENELLYENVAYVILDDISTRGTILNACEDILMENGVVLEDIYKFAIFQTVDDYD